MSGPNLANTMPTGLTSDWQEWHCPHCQVCVRIHQGDGDETECRCHHCNNGFTAGEARRGRLHSVPATGATDAELDSAAVRSMKRHFDIDETSARDHVLFERMRGDLAARAIDLVPPGYRIVLESDVLTPELKAAIDYLRGFAQGIVATMGPPEPQDQAEFDETMRVAAAAVNESTR